MIEERKDVMWYEWYYQVSNFWNMRSVKWWRIRILKQWICCRWYSIVRLCKDWVKKTIRIHRLVAIAFINNPNNYKEINHKNGIKTDNRIENLERCTRSENMKHMYLTSWIKKDCSHLRKKIEQYSLYFKHITSWEMIQDAADFTWINRNLISACLHWRQKTAWWFIWRFNNDTILSPDFKFRNEN